MVARRAGEERVDPLGRALLIVFDLATPVGMVDHHPGFARQLIPCRWTNLVVVEPERTTTGHIHHPVASPPRLGQRQGPEQRTPGHRVGEPARIRTVDSDAGGGELLLDDAHVRVRRREEHADAIEGDAICDELDDATAHLTNLFGSVGDRDHRGRRRGDRLDWTTVDARHLTCPPDRFVSEFDARDPDDDRRRRLPNRSTSPTNRPIAGVTRSRQIPDDVSERFEPLGEVDAVRRCRGEVVFGVESDQLGGDAPIELDGEHGRRRAFVLDRFEPLLVDVGQLGEQARQRRFGRFVIRDRSVHVGIVG